MKSICSGKRFYDPLGRCLAKVILTKGEYGWKESMREYYLYDGEKEIGLFKSSNTLESFRVLSPHPLPKTISVEAGRKTFAPLTDVQGNIRRLVDIKSKTLAASYDYSAFGEKLRANANDEFCSPWQFASKRFDPSLGLIYFGKRSYDPKIGRWITTDPAEFVDGTNLYQFLFNNPFSYVDPDGQFAFVIPLVIWGATAAAPSIAAIGTCIATGVATGAIAYGGYKLYESYQHSQLTDDPYAGYYSQGDSCTMQRKKKGGVDENLSDNPLNNPNLEDISHPQAREKGHYQLRDKKTGEIVHHDKGKPGATGHEAHDHYHRPNSNATGNHDKYLDAQGNPVPKGSEPSHLYPPEWVWWD